ncbi:MAG: TerC family protein, partial [Alphaproteobacteria bacterium]|nr:TerC family protein [Alphaproteobacteria bacterium]
MLELLTDPAAWASLVTLALLEIVLGVDNVIFLSIVSSRLPIEQQPRARRIGLILALAGRIILLFAISWIIGLTAPFFEIFALEISWRDIILAVGGLFLIFKATTEIHGMLEGNDEGHGKPGAAVFVSVLVQIFLLDLVFSLDSVLTAIGMADDIEIMVAAIVIAIGVMLWAAEPMSAFVH